MACAGHKIGLRHGRPSACQGGGASLRYDRHLGPQPSSLVRTRVGGVGNLAATALSVLYTENKSALVQDLADATCASLRTAQDRYYSRYQTGCATGAMRWRKLPTAVTHAHVRQVGSARGGSGGGYGRYSTGCQPGAPGGVGSGRLRRWLRLFRGGHDPSISVNDPGIARMGSGGVLELP